MPRPMSTPVCPEKCAFWQHLFCEQADNLINHRSYFLLGRKVTFGISSIPTPLIVSML